MRYWVVALLITLAAAYYQRKTGPTYPLRGSVELAGQPIQFRLERSHGGDGDQVVAIAVSDTAVHGSLFWRRYPSADPFAEVTMQHQSDELMAHLPHQPPAGKLEYRLILRREAATVNIPAVGTIITRFKGAVPIYILAPHILLMFLGMAYANRAGIEALRQQGNLWHHTLLATVLLILGGMVLGPLVQKYAFDAYWTGVPFGYDLTDNKTLIAVVAWLAALWAVRKNRAARTAVLAAAVLTLLVYLIPHSLFGSELQYK